MMIVYSLKCRKDHCFDAWFRDSAAFDRQVEAGDVACPVCGSKKVVKAPMAPSLARGGAARQEDSRSIELRRKLVELRQQVEKNCDYVGERFPEEARRIHYGETDPRGIYGESTPEEAKSLEEEGVKVQRIPWVQRENS